MKIKKYLPNNLKGWIKNKFILFNVKVMNNKNFSFSQAGEDLILRNIFSEKKEGFYVDIGAFHPFFISNTFYFYRFLNWRGINLDARPGSMAIFNKFRPRDINLEIAVADKEKELTYYFIDESSSMNSFSKEFLVRENMFAKVSKEIPVRTMPLAAIFEKHLPKGQKIDIMTIDIEGMELEAFASNDWDKFRPNVIVCEISAATYDEIFDDEITQYLLKINYQPQAITVLSDTLRNVIFVSDK